MSDQLVLDGMPPRPGLSCGVCGGARALAAFYGGQPLTYVMRRDRWVKIGKSKHPDTRLRELRAIGRQRYIICPDDMDRGLPIVLLATVDGDVEHELHERFEAQHAAGEWFHLAGAVAEWVAAL